MINGRRAAVRATSHGSGAYNIGTRFAIYFTAAAVPDASLITTTYNWPEALEAVLKSVARQRLMPREVVIADDGSGPATRETIDRIGKDFPCPIKHIWHEDNGYQAAMIRNKAVAAAEGDYLIFLDSDCILRPDFVFQHLRLGRPSHFVAGNRILLSESYSSEVLAQGIDLASKSPFSFSREQVNRRWSMLPLPMGPLRHVLPNTWKNVKACNMSMFREDFVRVNGFEERFEGWGYEDSDLIVRLLNTGSRRISGRFATTVYHLWHNSNKSQLEEGNWRRLQATVKNGGLTAERGIDQYPLTT